MADLGKTNASSSALFGGSCACGRIAYESTAMPTGGQTCHCVKCRKIGGSAFQGFADSPSNQVAFYDKKDGVHYEALPKDSVAGITFVRLMPGAERAFCVDCYSQLAMRYMHDFGTVGVTLGTIDEHTIRDDDVKLALKPKSHIFASQNPWWFDIKMDGLPLKGRFGGDYEEKMTEWVKENTT